MADAIKLNSTLQKIGLYSCGIGDKGAEWIADAIKANSTLQGIGLIGNHIGRDLIFQIERKHL
jgi:hypothetical protein